MKFHEHPGYLIGFVVLTGLSLRDFVRAESLRYEQIPIAVVIRGVREEQGVTALRRLDGGETLWVPLDDMAEMLGISIVTGRTERLLRTPLGDARLDSEDVLHWSGRDYIHIDVLSQKIATPITMMWNELLMIVRPPWLPPQRGDAGETPESPIRPDLRPSMVDLSRIRGDGRVQAERDSQWFMFADMEAWGRAGPGVWAVRAQKGSETELRVEEYHVRHSAGRSATLLGQALTLPYPQWPSLHLLGAQWAWSTHPKQFLSSSYDSSLLTPGDSAVRTIRGHGPAGGLAELRIDGLVVARERIRLDGEYVFHDVRVPPGYARIEVALYETELSTVPVVICDESGYGTRQVIPRGAAIGIVGGGLEGNPLDPYAEQRGLAAYGLARYGVADRMTMEAGALTREDGALGMVGVALDLRRGGQLDGSLSVHDASGATSSRMSWSLLHDSWLGQISVSRIDEGFGSPFTSRSADHLAELAHSWTNRLTLSMIGRIYEGPEGSARYVLPAVRAAPFQGIFWDSRPDSVGDYTHMLEWGATRDLVLRFRHDSFANAANLEYWLASGNSLSCDLRRQHEKGRWQGSLLYHWRRPNRRLLITAGPQSTEDQVGGLVRIGAELLPGFRGEMTLQYEPGWNDWPGRGWRGELRIGFDLGRTGAGFTRSFTFRYDDGAIGGRLLANGQALLREGIGIRVNGRRRATTDEFGRFRIGDLRPGIYKVELDDEDLPIEWQPIGDAQWVEVAAGAVTTVDIQVKLVLVVTGRIHLREGSPWAISELKIELIDSAGQVTARTAVGRGGRWRLDGIEPGTYICQAVTHDGQIVASTPLVLTDTSAFGIQLIPTP